MRGIKSKESVEHLLLDSTESVRPIHRALLIGVPPRRQHFGNLTRPLDHRTRLLSERLSLCRKPRENVCSASPMGAANGTVHR